MSETPLLVLAAREIASEWQAPPGHSIDTPFGHVVSIRVRCWEPNHHCEVKVYRNKDGTLRFDKDGFTNAAYKIVTGTRSHLIIGDTSLYDGDLFHAD